MLSQKAKFAIKALIVLARAKDGALVQVNEIAKKRAG